MTPEVNGPTTPGLLRLPPELRLQIYRNLCDDARGGQHCFPDGKPFSSERHPIRLPITQVCQLLRYEFVPYCYAKIYGAITFAQHWRLPRMLSWLQDADPYILRCLRGLQFMHSEHRCIRRFCSRTCVSFEVITVRFRIDGAEVSKWDVWECCADKAEFDKARELLIQNFIRRVEGNMEGLREELMKLVEAAYNLVSGED